MRDNKSVTFVNITKGPCLGGIYMGKAKIEDIVCEIARPVTDSLGLKLIDVEYKKEGNSYVLRVIIDKPGGVMIDDCEDVSHMLGVKLDEMDPIENSYSLEVQSPGERILRHDWEFEYFSGRDVEVKLYEAQDKKKVFKGKLQGLKDKSIYIILEDGTMKEFKRDKVSSVRLRIIF